MMMNLLLKYQIPLFSPEDGGGTAPPSGNEGGATSSPSPSGGTESPSSTPPSTPSSEGAVAPSGEGFDFSSIFEGAPAELPTKDLVQPAPPVKPPATPPQPPPAAAATVPPVATPPAQPATPGTATPQPQAAPTEQPEFDRYDPGTLARHLASNQEQALNYVAENVFKLTPQEVEGLETNAADAIPKLLAKVFVKSQQNVLSQLASIVPQMIQRQTVAIRRNDENAEKFYQRWPNIQKATHGDLVNKYGAVYRQMHPQATLEQMVEDLGPMVMMAARIPPQVQAPVPGTPVVNPAATRAANGRAPPPSPFVPAGAAAPASTATAPEVSPWEAMFRPQD